MALRNVELTLPLLAPPAHPAASAGPARNMAISDVEVGKEYDGVVVSIRDFGAFVNIGAQADGLLHISQVGARLTATSVWLALALRSFAATHACAGVPCRGRA